MLTEDRFFSPLKMKLLSAVWRAILVDAAIAGLLGYELWVLLPESCPAIPSYVQEYFCPSSEDLFFIGSPWRIIVGTWIVAWCLFPLFLCSRWQASPGMKIFGLRLSMTDGERPTFPKAAEYFLVAVFPWHVAFLYISLTGPTHSLYQCANAVFLALYAQYVLSSLFLFGKGDQSWAQKITHARLYFTPTKLEKIRKRQKKYKRFVWFYLGTTYGFRIVILLFFTFVILNILSEPELDSGYETMLYANKAPVWEDNAVFAFQGLAAPPEVKDFYAFGRYSEFQQFRAYEWMKKEAGIPISYDAPDIPMPANYQPEGGRLKVTEQGKEDPACMSRFKYRPEEGFPPCMSPEGLTAFIKNNRILWDRFETLPSYKTFSTLPKFIGGEPVGTPLKQAAQMKAAQIGHMASQGEATKAFEEWYRYMRLYRAMVSSNTDAMLVKDIFMTVWATHLQVLEVIINSDPAVATLYKDEISEVLKPEEGIGLFRGQHILEDDLAILEPWFLLQIGHSANIRMKMWQCIQGAKAFASSPDQIFIKNKPACSLENKSSDEVMLEGLVTPGNPVSNSLAYLLFQSPLKERLRSLKNMYVNDAMMRMYSLGVRIVQKKIEADRISDYIQSSPPESLNPLTKKPFQWDAKEKRLFFARPGSSIETSFHLPFESRAMPGTKGRF
ncbi:MAG: RDD family protein [Pseudomonadota bacterium]